MTNSFTCWVINSYRSGENSQIHALARALGSPYETKQLVYRSWDFVPGLLRTASLIGIDRRASSPLAPPWPDLLISAGMRNEPVCRWIKRQSPTTKLIHIGRTWSAMEHFDLIVTTPQYRLPRRANVLHNSITLHSVHPTALAEAAAHWQPRLAHLPVPYLTVLIGGNSGPYTFGRNSARRLAGLLSRLRQSFGGSLLISTSARTPTAFAEALEKRLQPPFHFHHWRPEDPDNPYLAFLGLAHSIVVTCDSVAMLSEAVATGKPVYMFDPGPGTASGTDDFRLGALLYRQLMRFGPQRLSRDVGLVHQRFIDEGRAAWLTEQPTPLSPPPPPDDMQRTVCFIRERLLGDV